MPIINYDGNFGFQPSIINQESLWTAGVTGTANANVTAGYNFKSYLGITSETIIYDNGTFKLTLKPGDSTRLRWGFYYDGQDYSATSYLNCNLDFAGLCFGIDETNQRGYFIFTWGPYGQNLEYTWVGSGLIDNSNNGIVYRALKSVPPVPVYQWTSVPTIRGKNGILLLMSTLNDINDGNEVTTSDTSKFNPNDSSNIKNLVDAVVNDF